MVERPRNSTVLFVLRPTRGARWGSSQASIEAKLWSIHRAPLTNHGLVLQCGLGVVLHEYLAWFVDRDEAFIQRIYV